MKELRLFLATLLVALAVPMTADTYSYITVGGSEGAKSYEIADVEQITFSADSMLVHLSSGAVQQLALSGLSTMEFSNTNGIAIVDKQASIHLTGDGLLRINTDEGAQIFLYNVGGRLEKTVRAAATPVDIDMRSLPRGIYVVRVNNSTKKIVNQ